MLEQDELLCNEDNFVARTKALDFLELQLIDDEQVNNPALMNADALTLYRRTQALKLTLDNVNEKLFTRLLDSIRSGDRLTVRQYFRQLEQQLATGNNEVSIGYDEIDMLVWGLLDVKLIPEEPEKLEPEMVYYQPSATRIILNIIKNLDTSPDDVFYDLGSGLGHVAILVNLFTNIRTKGVEIQEFYCRYSNECLKKLRLSNVAFVNADARDAEYDDGTIFYMYTPFRGEILRQVLEKLRVQSRLRPIRVCTFGPCTAEVAEHDWLQPIYQMGKKESALAIFASQ